MQEIFLFITRQLKGLEDTKSPQFNRYFYLLEVRISFIQPVHVCNLTVSLIYMLTSGLAPDVLWTVFYILLQNLAWVKSYNICFELEDCNEIFIQLFKTLFSVIK